MTRVVAGVAGGRRLVAPKGTVTRPTSDRVREAVFSRLEHLGALDGAVVLDLYAGSGALGLEAASRGCAHVELVDDDRAALAALRANVRTVAAAGAAAGIEIVGDTVARYLHRPPPQRGVDLALLDPPYDVDEATLGEVLGALVGRLAPGAVVVVERSARGPGPSWPRPLEPLGDRRYGETHVWYAQAPIG